MRLFGLAALAGMFAFAGAAHAAALPFDPEEATRAWLATMGPEATQRSNAYFEGGYIIEYVGAAIGILIGLAWLMTGAAKNLRS